MNTEKEITRIELDYIEPLTQEEELKRISKLPPHLYFKVKPAAKILFFLGLVGGGLAAGTYLYYQLGVFQGALVAGISVALYLIVYLISPQLKNKKITVGKKGIDIEKKLYEWEGIDDLHLTQEGDGSRAIIRICFNYRSDAKEFPLESVSQKTSQIVQILHVYQRAREVNIEEET